MAKSRKRGGDTAHRKRVKSRNQRIMSEFRKQNALLRAAMEEQLEKLRSESGNTETSEVIEAEVINNETNEPIQSPENI